MKLIIACLFIAAAAIGFFTAPNAQGTPVQACLKQSDCTAPPANRCQYCAFAGAGVKHGLCTVIAGCH